MEVLCESKAVDLKHLFKYLLFFLIMEDSNFFYKICVKTLRYTRLELRQNIFFNDLPQYSAFLWYN